MARLLWWIILTTAMLVDVTDGAWRSNSVDAVSQPQPTRQPRQRGPFFRIPIGTKWTMNNELVLPFQNTNVKLTIPVTYEFKNTSRFAFVKAAARTFGDDFKDGGEEEGEDSDQLGLFNSIESSLRSLGLDGQSCLLRAICEINDSPAQDLTLIGEVITLLLTPRKSLKERRFLFEYLRAEDIGRTTGDCWRQYRTCPFSVVSILDGIRFKR